MPKKENKEVKCYLAVSNQEYSNRQNVLNETFKGETIDKDIRFPKGLGAEHPFEFEKAQLITTNIGIINSAVDKIVDAIIGDFTIIVSSAKNKKDSDPKNAQTVIDSFINDANFNSAFLFFIFIFTYNVELSDEDL